MDKKREMYLFFFLYKLYNINMKQYYTTGQFAKKAGTTQRTIRYYDKIGLLKPSLIMENGYRKYSETDLLKLQRIIALKHFGFSLEEIYPMLASDNQDSFKESLAIQLNLVNKKIAYLQTLKESLINTNRLLEKGNLQWDRIADLIKLSGEEDEIVDHYRAANNLATCIRLHKEYGTNSLNWYSWIYQQIDFSSVNRLLEVGCGNGELWAQMQLNLRHREFFLTDNNMDMLEETRKKVSNEFNILTMDCQDLTFKSDFFDCVIANHMLFHLTDLQLGLSEIARVLKNSGIFYCTTYGANHMQEISELMHEYDSSIHLVENHLEDKFGLENGEKELLQYFESVELRRYEDSLLVKEAKTLIEYILSCSGNQNERIVKDINGFKKFIEEKIAKDNGIKITKNVGMFICKNNA